MASLGLFVRTELRELDGELGGSPMAVSEGYIMGFPYADQTLSLPGNM